MTPISRSRKSKICDTPFFSGIGIIILVKSPKTICLHSLHIHIYIMPETQERIWGFKDQALWTLKKIARLDMRANMHKY
jgi:hypothetical protein